MVKKRRYYTAEFKAEAVRLAQAKDRSLADVARALGVHATSLQYWLQRATPPAPPAVPATPEALAAENRRLRKQVARLEEERDILKKAAAYFANASR